MRKIYSLLIALLFVIPINGEVKTDCARLGFVNFCDKILSPGCCVEREYSSQGSKDVEKNSQNLSRCSICLSLIVKNDEAVIDRCLNSVKDIVDCISICDVGSTDNTIAKVHKFFRTSGIPGHIYQQEWQNLSNNKTLSIEAAKKTLQELGFSLSQAYVLALDPDMVLKPRPKFNKKNLTADSYSLLEKSSALGQYTFENYLLHASSTWLNTDSLFGSWSYRQPHLSTRLSTLMIENLNDANSTADQRDINLLEQTLKNGPSDASLILRLGHLHRCQQSYDHALHYYNTYLDQAYDKEGIWFTKYLIGKCLEEQGQWDLATQWYLDAYQYNPNRTEPVLKLATHYRVKGQTDLAYHFAKKGSQTTRDEDQLLFDISPFDDYQFDEELSIAAFYTSFKDEGYRAASDLLIKKNVPGYVKYQTYKNTLFYVQKLKSTRCMPIRVDLPLIREGFEERYHPMNPSIQKTQRGYKVICRAVNYTQKGAISSNFKTIDPNGIFRTKNYLVHYDRDFKMLSQQEIIENLPRHRIYNFSQGLEDCRIFEFNQHSWFTCTTSDTNPTGQRQISLCQLSNKQDEKEVAVAKLIPLKGPDLNRCEKNWLPFAEDGSIYAIYSYDPFIVFKLDANSGDCETILEYKPDFDFSGFRGSAAPIKYNDGYLILVHEIAHMPDESRNYLHRFAFLDKDFIIQQVSRPFIFFHQGIEFCCSMTLNHAETELIMGVGIEDGEAYLFSVDLETVASLLNPLPRVL